MHNNTPNHRDELPAFMAALAAYGKSYVLRSQNKRDWLVDWENPGSHGDPIALLDTGLRVLIERLQSVRHEVVAWKSRLWQEDCCEEGSSGYGTGAQLLERLHLLDELVFLLVASKRLPPSQKMLFAPITKRFEDLYDNEETFYRDDSWCLIPLNVKRRERLKDIATEQVYLFPWYEEWSDVPAQTLDMLVEFVAGQPIDSGRISPARLEQLRGEVEHKPEDAANLAKHVFLARELPPAVRRAYALRWRMAAEEAGLWQKTRLQSEAKVCPSDLNPIIQDILNGVTPLVWRLKAALMITSLSRQERLGLLQTAEDELVTAVRAGNTPALPEWLQVWLQGGITDADLIQKIIASWHATGKNIRHADTRELEHSALMSLLESSGKEATLLAEHIARPTDVQQLYGRNKNKKQIKWPEKLLSLFKLPVLALGTAATSVLLFLLVFHQSDDDIRPIAINMQVFGRSELQMRGITPPTSPAHPQPPQSAQQQAGDSPTVSGTLRQHRKAPTVKPKPKPSVKAHELKEKEEWNASGRRSVRPQSITRDNDRSTSAQSRSRDDWSVSSRGSASRPAPRSETKDTAAKPPQAVPAPVAKPEPAAEQQSKETTIQTGKPALSPPFEVLDGGNLKSGDYYHIRVSTDRDAYVYLLVSSQNKSPILLLQDRIKAGDERELPGNGQLFQLDQEKGMEWIYLVTSEKELPVQETLATGLTDGEEATLKQVFPEASIRRFRLEHR